MVLHAKSLEQGSNAAPPPPTPSHSISVLTSAAFFDLLKLIYFGFELSVSDALVRSLVIRSCNL